MSKHSIIMKRIPQPKCRWCEHTWQWYDRNITPHRTRFLCNLIPESEDIDIRDVRPYILPLRGHELLRYSPDYCPLRKKDV